ncbi:hypothetical protein HDU76_010591, partial [Blyttiomyces sp. JEL0837]
MESPNSSTPPHAPESTLLPDSTTSFHHNNNITNNETISQTSIIPKDVSITNAFEHSHPNYDPVVIPQPVSVDIATPIKHASSASPLINVSPPSISSTGIVFSDNSVPVAADADEQGRHVSPRGLKRDRDHDDEEDEVINRDAGDSEIDDKSQGRVDKVKILVREGDNDRNANGNVDIGYAAAPDSAVAMGSESTASTNAIETIPNTTTASPVDVSPQRPKPTPIHPSLPQRPEVSATSSTTGSPPRNQSQQSSPQKGYGSRPGGVTKRQFNYTLNSGPPVGHPLWQQQQQQQKLKEKEGFGGHGGGGDDDYHGNASDERSFGRGKGLADRRGSGGGERDRERGTHVIIDRSQYDKSHHAEPGTVIPRTPSEVYQIADEARNRYR